MRIGRATALIVALLFAAGTLALLPRLAAWVVGRDVVAQSERERSAYEHGRSPWEWTFRSADDLVAGRVFGHASVAGGTEGLALTGGDGSPVELGLPLIRAVDLTQLPRLRLDMSAPPGTSLRFAVRERLDGPKVTTDAATFGPDTAPLVVPLSGLSWKDEQGHDTAAPTRAAMFRLVLPMAPGAAITLRTATFQPGSPPAPELTRTVALPPASDAETLLRWRDTLWEGQPTTMFGPATTRLPVTAVNAGYRDWIALALYLAGLLWLSWRPPVSRPGKTLEAVAGVLGPLWLIAGMRLDAHPSVPAAVCFAAGIVFAGALAGRRRLPPWTWLGSPIAIALPLLAIPAATLLVALLGHAPVWPPAGRIFLYVGWALLQQWLMLAVTAALLDRLLPRPLTLLVTALTFALLHTPNGSLMQLCFIAELGWAWCFLRYRALLPVALAHAASAVLLQAGLAGGVLRSLEVSARFLN
ncbi:hypothetical protein EC912_101282 [Luteibacter rhizovicinus]|uniref:CAAX prenyl protease 2/Lysostaphin resistance protein A-like domain-containing protein n=1 Tax=Luteibacter rhizovicinus TaxID=242606 RepID=A0A4R3YXK9_9GAMM|nr:CPBP family intramembrane glutamic endopeptidase [Luteibacter rhizovicinus]TCV97282.1 hypothetical protein EC912_101282 [Luteibacter rhizovicinus]